MGSDTRPSTMDEKEAHQESRSDVSQHESVCCPCLFFLSRPAVLTAVQSTIRTSHKDEPPSEAPVAIITTELHPESDLENNIIGWDSQDDPENPK